MKNRVDLKNILTPVIAVFQRKELLEAFKKQGVPAGAIRNMKEVFELEQAKDMILEEEVNNEITRRVKTVAFELLTD